MRIFINKKNSRSVLSKIILIIAIVSFGMAFFQVSNNPSNDFGEMKLIEDGRGMKMEFHPTNRVNCKRIVLTQTAQITFKNGADVNPKPSDIVSYWDYRDDDALSNGTFVDHASTSEDPEINGEDRDARTGREAGSLEDLGTAGKRDDTGTTPSTTFDYPWLSSGTFPAGKTRVVLKIEVCASCAEGADVGTVYGCATWEYTQTNAGPTTGDSNSTSDATLDPPSSDFTQAVDLFEENHLNEDGERHCPD